jgi:hypothetical protein
MCDRGTANTDCATANSKYMFVLICLAPTKLCDRWDSRRAEVCTGFALDTLELYVQANMMAKTICVAHWTFAQQRVPMQASDMERASINMCMHVYTINRLRECMLTERLCNARTKCIYLEASELPVPPEMPARPQPRATHQVYNT